MYTVFFQSGPNSRLPGWADFVKEAARKGIPVGGAITDSRAIYDDIVKYGAPGSQINWRPTEGPSQEEMQVFAPEWVWGRYKIDNPDYNHYDTREAAMAAYTRGASYHVDATLIMCNKSVIDVAHPFVHISTWNEIRKETGWASYQPIPGFTGWADVAGWQAYLIGKELLKRRAEGKPWFKWAAFAFAAGCPELDAWEQPGMLAYLKLAGEHPDVLGVALHEYSLVQDIWDGFDNHEKIGRVVYLNRTCYRNRIPVPWVHIKELGWGERKVPDRTQAIKDIEGLATFYETIPNVKLGALWTVNGGWSPASDLLPTLAEDVYQLALNWEPTQPPATTTTTLVDPEPPKHKVVVNLLKQDATLDYSQQVLAQIYDKRQTLTYSEDDARTLLESGNSDSEIVRWKEDKVPAFRYTHWPTNTKKINQPFGANPQIYQKYGLPGHEGIDITAVMGSPIFAPADGVITSIHTNASDGHAYGIYVRITHGETGYETTLAHNLSLNVRVGDVVKGGQLIALADSTGNSTGSHCHLTLKSSRASVGGLEYIGYPYNIIDPSPFLLHLLDEAEPIYSATVTAKNGLRLRAEPNTTSEVLDVMPNGTIVTVYREEGTWRLVKYNGLVLGWGWGSYLAKIGSPTYDLAEYMVGDGRMYEVRHPSGATETFQTQKEGGLFYYVKNSQWEQLWHDEDYIWRGYDTSPGPAPAGSERPGASRFFRQYETGKNGARWAKRHMELGETWRGSGHTVQFYYKSDCAKSAVNSGGATNSLKLVAYHKSKTFNGIVINDVLEVLTATGETMFFGKGYGLVAWQASWGSSAIVEKLSGRPNLKREQISCL